MNDCLVDTKKSYEIRKRCDSVIENLRKLGGWLSNVEKMGERL